MPMPAKQGKFPIHANTQFHFVPVSIQLPGWICMAQDQKLKQGLSWELELG
jgi:hypothetical protein